MSKLFPILILLASLGGPGLACGPRCRIFKDSKDPMVTFNRNLDKRGCACAQLGTDGPDLYCSRVGRPEAVLEGVEREIEPDEMIEKLHLMDCTLPRLPEGLFLARHVRQLRLERTSLLSLNPTSFLGSEDTLNTLHISDNPYVSSWDWSAFNVLQSLKELIILNCELTTLVSEQISALPASLNQLNLNFNNIEKLIPQIFRVTNLTTISFHSNKIVDISEKVFPTSLATLILAKNKLSSLPPSLLEDLPNLSLLDLRGNDFVELDARVFQNIMMEDYLAEHLTVQLWENPLDCCRLVWLFESDLQNAGVLLGKCTSPVELKDQDIKEISLISSLKHCPHYDPPTM